MRRPLQIRYFLLLMPLFFLQMAVKAQIPTATSLPVSEDFNTTPGASGTAYPSGFGGMKAFSGGVSASYETGQTSTSRSLTAGSASSTSSSNNYNFSSKIGFLSDGSNICTILLAINTTGATNIAVQYDISTIRIPASSVVEEVTLQYYAGGTISGSLSSGSFINLTGIEYQNPTTPTTTSGTTALSTATKTITLPAACENKSIVYLRWIARLASGSISGNNLPSFAIDNISVATAACTTPTLGTVAQAATVCGGTNATINLTGLVASSSNNTVHYNIAGGSDQTATVSANASGNGNFSVAVTNANNGQVLTITSIVNGTCSTTFSKTVTLAVNTAPTLSLGTNPSVASGVTSASLSYSVTNSPDQYSITYDAAALAAGFSNIATTTIATSPLSLTVPGAASPGTYNGTMAVYISSSGCSVSAAFTITILPQYVWTGTAGNNNWSTATNWSPNRNSITTSDELIFNSGATITITTMPATETDAKVTVTNGSTVTLSGTSTLTISSALSIDVTSTLTEAATVNITISGGTSTINGRLVVSAGTYTTTAGVTSVDGATAVLRNTGGTVTGSATGLLFKNGATYTHARATGTIPTANWTSNGGSAVYITGATAASPSGLGQSFNNFYWDCASQTAALTLGSSASTTISGILGVNTTGTGTLQLLSSPLITLSPSSYIQTGGTVNESFNQGSAGTRALIVSGDFIMLGTAAFYVSKDVNSAGCVNQLTIGGDLSVGSTASIYATDANSRTPTVNITFNGDGSGGTRSAQSATFTTLNGAAKINIIVNKAAGTLQLNSDLNISGNLTLTAGLLSITSGKTVSISSGATISTSTGDFSPSSSGTMTLLGTTTVTGAINFYPAIIQSPSSTLGVNYGTSTVHSTLQLNTNSYMTNAPIYATGSTLIYNTGGTYGRNVEWGSLSSYGYPYNVQVGNGVNTILDLSANASADRACAGSLTISSGSGFAMNALPNKLTVYGNVNIAGSLTLSSAFGGDIHLEGNWTRTGTFTANDRAVYFEGTAASTITATSGETFPYLRLSKTSASVVLGTNVNITYEVSPNSGSLDLSNYDLTLLSSSASTARVTQVANGFTFSYSGTGRFVAQRYIPAHRSWRLLCAPLTSTQTINAAWQEGQTNSSLINSNTTPGYGTHISGPQPNGFDYTPRNNYSILQYNSATDWTGVPNTTSTNVSSQPYMLFVRGSRAVDLSLGTYATADNTILRSKGTLRTGDQGFSINTSVGKFIAIGNPYPSAIDFHTLSRSGGLPDKFTIWDPNLAGSYYVGGYVTYEWIAGSYFATPTPASSNLGRYIQSGQAFMIEGTGTSETATAKETDKVSGSYSDIFSALGPAPSNIRINLLADEGAGSTTLVDGTAVVYNQGYSNSVDVNDASKLQNFRESIGLKRNTSTLAIETREPLQLNDTLFLRATSLFQRNYQIQVVPSGIDASVIAVLKDNYLNTTTAVDIVNGTSYSFTVTADPASASENRFVIYLQPAAPLPVTFTAIKAYQQNDGVQVEWSVSQELNTDKYVVEHSGNGIDFIPKGTVRALGNAQNARYDLYDARPFSGVNFYRIKTIDKNGQSKYSPVVKVQLGTAVPSVSLYPNPIVSNSVNLQLTGLNNGIHTVTIINKAGQVVYKSTITFMGGTASQLLKLPQLASGYYSFKVDEQSVEVFKQ